MEDDILIDNYLKGLLSNDDEVSFLERLKADSDFNKKFKLEEQLFNALNEDNWSFVEESNEEFEAYKQLLESDEIQNLKKMISHTTSEFNKKPLQKNNVRRLFYYIAAASVVVFLGFQLFLNQSLTNQELYNSYIDLDDLPSFVSRNNGSNTLPEAQELFEDKNYEEALLIFNEKSNDVENLGHLLIYKAISQIELEKYKEAAQTLDELINSDLLDAEKGYWYKALLFLKENRKEEAKQILKYIIENRLYNNINAEDLLKELD